MLLGAHVSIAGGVFNAPTHGVRMACDVIQMFSRNQRQWAAKPLSRQEIEQFRANYDASGLKGVVVHGSYLVNLASPDPATQKRSLEAFMDEAVRCDQLGIPDLVFHPGAHLEQGLEPALKRIAAAMQATLAKVPEGSVRLDLEVMAGQGSTIGNRLEDLRTILELVGDRKRTGVCLDTCHLHAAGYDLATPTGYEDSMKAVERVIGLASVRAFHLNDSKTPLGSRVDRHEGIGEGTIGTSGFGLLMNDERFAHVPMNLETDPGLEDAGYKQDLRVLRGLIGKRAPAPKRNTLESFAAPKKGGGAKP